MTCSLADLGCCHTADFIFFLIGCRALDSQDGNVLGFMSVKRIFAVAFLYLQSVKAAVRGIKKYSSEGETAFSYL